MQMPAVSRTLTGPEERPALRNAIRWRHIFGGGLVERETLAQELKRAAEGRYGGSD